MSQQLEKAKLTPIIGTVKGTNLKLYNWNGTWIIVGQGKNTHILDEIKRRMRQVEQNFFLIVGSPGKGKSYYALRLCEILDPKFNPQIQIVFERAKLLKLIGPDSPLRMGSCILIDESQYLAGSRRWQNEIQTSIMENLEAIRSRGFCIIVTSLHIATLDVILRKYVLSHLISMNKRGQGTVYELFMPIWDDKLFKRKLGHMALQMPDGVKCDFPSCLICKFIKNCMTTRAQYERLKTEFLGMMNRESVKKADAKVRRAQPLSYEAIINKIVSEKANLTYLKNGNAEPESVRMMFEKDGIVITQEQAKTAVKRGIIKHPEVFTRGDKNE